MPPEDPSVAPSAAASFASGASASAFAGIPWFLPGPLAITRRGVWLVLWGAVLTALLTHAGGRAIDCFRSLERARQYEEDKNVVPAGRLPPGVPGPELPLPPIREKPGLATPPHAEPYGGA